MGTTAGKQQLYLKHIHIQTKKTRSLFTKCANRRQVGRKKGLMSPVNSWSHEITMVTFHELYSKTYSQSLSKVQFW